MKTYIAPEIAVDVVMPDTAISSNDYYVCTICDGIAGKTQMADQLASLWNANPGQFVVQGDSYFACVGRILE